MPVRVAINGFGRIGRAALRGSFERDADIEWVAINDLFGALPLAQLLRRDTVYGRFDRDVERRRRRHRRRRQRDRRLAEPDPARCPGTTSASTS